MASPQQQRRTSHKPTTAFLTPGSGQILQRLSAVKSGSNCSATGTLVLASNSKTTTELLRDMPHTFLTRYYFATPNIDEHMDEHNSIGVLDMIDMTTSKDSKHGSVLMLNLGQTESLALQAPQSVGGSSFGNQREPGYFQSQMFDVLHRCDSLLQVLTYMALP